VEQFAEGLAALAWPAVSAMFGVQPIAVQGQRVSFAKSKARRNSAPLLPKLARKKERQSEIHSGPKRAVSFDRYFPRRAAYQI
jgi:hypothetical protein